MSNRAESGSGFSGCVVVAGSSQEDRAEVVALFFVGFVVRFEGAPEAEKKVWCDEGGRVVLGDRGEPSQQGHHLGNGQTEDVDAAEPDGVLAAGGLPLSPDSKNVLGLRCPVLLRKALDRKSVV